MNTDGIGLKGRVTPRAAFAEYHAAFHAELQLHRLINRNNKRHTIHERNHSAVATNPASPTPPLQPDEVRQRTWNMWCHLSALSGLLVPFGNFLGPLLVWQIRKHELPGVEAHARAALNFQITLFLAGLAGIALAFVSVFFCLGFLFVPLIVLLLAALSIAALVFTVIAGIQANDGREYHYPWSLKLL